VLEVKKSCQSVRTEYTVHFSGIESERVEKLLQVGNVIPPHHRHTVVEEAVPQSVACVDYRSPCLWTDNSINRESTVGLESGNSGECPLTEDTRLVREHRVVKRRESILHIAYRFASISLVIEPHEPGSS
jgi:hypothetical protein